MEINKKIITKNLYNLNIPGLLEIQKASYYQFLYKNLYQFFSDILNPSILNITNNKNLTNFTFLYFFSNNIKFLGPYNDFNKCIKSSSSYTISIYLLIEYIKYTKLYLNYYYKNLNFYKYKILKKIIYLLVIYNENFNASLKNYFFKRKKKYWF